MVSLLQGHTRSEEESHRSPCLEPDAFLTMRLRGEAGFRLNSFCGLGEQPWLSWLHFLFMLLGTPVPGLPGQRPEAS